MHFRPLPVLSVVTIGALIVLVGLGVWQLERRDEKHALLAEVAKGATDMSRSASEAAKGANDVSRNAGEAAKGIREISSNIHGVSQATKDNTASAQHMNTAAAQLRNVAGELRRIVGRLGTKVEV